MERKVYKMDNIVLIGMPGAGKSTIGVILAKALGMPFVDTDLLIQEKEGRLLQDIIDTDGIDHFILIEEKSILSMSNKHSVVATGGSVIYSEKGMKHLKENGRVVYLNLAFDEIRKRLNNINTRGIVIDKGASLLAVYHQRGPLYELYADEVVDCNGKDTERIVDEIIGLVKKGGGA